MTATNHTLTGIVIGLAVHEPVLAIMLAVLSHFILDALPHYGGDPTMIGKRFAPFLFADASVAALLLLSLIVLQPQYWVLAVVCGIAAASPDIMWFPTWLRDLKGKPSVYNNFVLKFHEKIQWASRPKNYVYEIVWFAGAFFLLVKVI